MLAFLQVIPARIFVFEIKERDKHQYASRHRNKISRIDKKVQPAYVMLPEVFVDDGNHTSDIPERIRQVNQEGHRPDIFKSSEEPVEKNAVELNVSEIKSHADHRHPHRRRDHSLLKSERC